MIRLFTGDKESKPLISLDSRGASAPTPIYGPLDCHAIIRSYFGGVVRSNVPAWCEANNRLFKYYAAAAPEEQPTSREDITSVRSKTVKIQLSIFYYSLAFVI